MKKTTVKPVDDWFTFKNRCNKTIEFEFQDVLPLDVNTTCGDIECNGILISHDDDYEKIALPVRVNTERGEVISIDILEYNDY
jgi:hypothetical protein